MLSDHEVTSGTSAPEGASEDRSEHWAGVLTLPTAHGKALIPIDRIVRLRADGSYTFIHTLVGKPLLVSRKLGKLHSQLPTHQFVRCHDSHVVNLRMLSEVVERGGHQLVMVNGDVVPVSRRNWKELKIIVERI